MGNDHQNSVKDLNKTHIRKGSTKDILAKSTFYNNKGSAKNLLLQQKMSIMGSSVKNLMPKLSALEIAEDIDEDKDEDKDSLTESEESESPESIQNSTSVKK